MTDASELLRLAGEVRNDVFDDISRIADMDDRVGGGFWRWEGVRLRPVDARAIRDALRKARAIASTQEQDRG